MEVGCKAVSGHSPLGKQQHRQALYCRLTGKRQTQELARCFGHKRLKRPAKWRSYLEQPGDQPHLNDLIAASNYVRSDLRCSFKYRYVFVGNAAVANHECCRGQRANAACNALRFWFQIHDRKCCACSISRSICAAARIVAGCWVAPGLGEIKTAISRANINWRSGAAASKVVTRRSSAIMRM